MSRPVIAGTYLDSFLNMLESGWCDAGRRSLRLNAVDLQSVNADAAKTGIQIVEKCGG